MKTELIDSIEKAINTFTHLLDDWLERNNSKRHELKGGLAKESEIFHRSNEGFNLNGRRISKKLSYQNVLINGTTGSKKTVGSVIKSVICNNSVSQINHDPSKEIFFKTSGAKHAQGAEMLQLDYDSPETSVRFNPILRCSKPSQIALLAFALVFISDGTSKIQSSYWNKKAVEALIIVISILKTQDEKYQTLYQAAYLLDMMIGKTTSAYVDHLFAEFASKELFTRFCGLSSSSEDTLSNIISTAKASVQLFQMDENIARITSSDTLGNFDRFRKKHTIMYIHSSTTKTRYYSKISSILFDQYFNHFFEKMPSDSDLDVLFHWDEMPLLTLNNADVIASNIRKYRGGLLMVCQDAKNQLEAKYGKNAAQSILTNLRTKAYFSASLSSARELEIELGRYEYIDKETGVKKTRSVLTVDEILSLSEDKVLITVTGKRPILSRIIPYYKERKIRKLSDLPPYEPEIIEDSHLPIPLLDLEAMYPEVKSENNKQEDHD